MLKAVHTPLYSLILKSNSLPLGTQQESRRTKTEKVNGADDMPDIATKQPPIKSFLNKLKKDSLSAFGENVQDEKLILKQFNFT